MEKLVQLLRPSGALKKIKKGSNVYFQGEVPRHAVIVRDGIIRAYTITSSGEERVVALYGRGDILPISWVLGETSNVLFYYDAVNDARVMTVSKQSIEAALDSDKEAMRELLAHVGNVYTSLLLRITGLEQSRAIEKIAFTLYYLLFRYGVEIEQGVFRLDIKLSQLMISNLVGLTRESTTKNLTLLRDKKVIEYSSSIYTIHKQRLEHFIGEDSFRDLTL